METPIEQLRADLLRLDLSYSEIAEVAGFEKHGSSYVRKFAAGEIVDLTTQRFFALKAAVKKLSRKSPQNGSQTA